VSAIIHAGLTAVVIILAAICKAVADTVTHHYDTSIFRKKDRKFWDPAISWKYAKNFPLTTMKMDGWHYANSGMIFFFCAAIVAHVPLAPWYLEYPVAGFLFNIWFSFFYNKILR
jgi:hypothetical protein